MAAGRPTTAPRLSRLDPDALADQVATSMLQHLQTLYLQTVGTPLPAPPQPRQTAAWLVVHQLARFACGHALAVDDRAALLEQARAIWASPELRGTLTAALDTPLGVALLAAEGRVQLDARGGRLSTRQLAALADMAQRAVASLCRSGELAAAQEADGEWWIAAKDARRWLERRAR